MPLPYPARKIASLASNAGISAENSITDNRQRANGSLSASGDPVNRNRPLVGTTSKAGRRHMHKLSEAT